jgi:hypothetical protein
MAWQPTKRAGSLILPFVYGSFLGSLMPPSSGPALGHELALSGAPGTGTDLADLSQGPPSASKVSRDDPGFVPKSNEWRWISGEMV